MRSTARVLGARRVFGAVNLVNSSQQWNFACRHQSTTTTTAVVVPQEPEFEGEMNAPQQPPHQSLSTSTTFDPAKLSMGVQRRSMSSDARQVDHVFDAYMGFFEHIRFRNGWATPPFSRDTVSPLFREAAAVTVRIRNFLDTQDSSTKLRKADGEAQTFLHSKEAQEMVEQSSDRKFVIQLVHATFRDAVGYVEGLTKDKVDGFLAEIFEYQYNPRAHALHQLEWLRANLNHNSKILLSVERNAPSQSTHVHPLERTTSHFCPTDEEEEKWRKVVGRLYDAMNEVQRMLDDAEGADAKGK